MKMKSLLGIMLSLSILQSCQNDETNGIQNEVNKNGITFMSLIDDTNNSRAYDTSWETNDVIGVFMLASENKNILETNVPYVTSKGDGYFISQNQPMYYPEIIALLISLHITRIMKIQMITLIILSTSVIRLNKMLLT